MVSLILHAFPALFAIMNPFGNLPIFVSLTDKYEAKEKRAIARKSVFISFILLTIFLLLGNYILGFFGITLNAFRVAGGIIIFGIAYNLLHAKKSHSQSLHEQEHEESLEKDDISVTPLATPILAGPGTIATVMTLSAGTTFNLNNWIAVAISYTVVLIIIYILFRYADLITKHLGTTELNVITRLMGLILAIIAVQMTVSGISGLFPHL